MKQENKKVVIIGGGITGIAVAYYLQKEIKEKGLPLEYTLIEASHRLGGKIQTVRRDGFVIERGPDSFLERKLSASRLVKEVGLQEELVNNSTGKSYVLVKDKLHRIPEGAVMGVPTEISPFVTTGLFSPLGKVRAAADFVMPRTNVKGDQSLGQFFRRRLGDEVVENLIEPLLSGIYAGDIDQLSLMSTFPQFYHAEQKHGSVIVGMKKMKALQPKAKSERQKKGAFLTLKSGLQSLVEAVEEKLDSTAVMKGIRVEKVTRGGNKYWLTMSNGKTMEVDSVIVTSPHLAAQSMLSHYAALDSLKNMPSTSVATVALAFPKEAIKNDIDGTGFVVSRNSDYTITACTWTHKKWPHTTPDGKVLLRGYVGKAGDEAIVDQSDDEIVKVVMDDLDRIMDIAMKPEFSIVSRWKHAMPQYTVGHKERLESINKHLKSELPGLFLSGSSYEGLGLPDCIDQAEAAVKKVIQYCRM
ncbi:protoporphyrinogen oxidase [Bacillus songklensis]|uniref:Coproporphyrinogen III oxidase n=1 Tax=Bacillus songklensis TaxID=1069116 RepID=A0ABV8B0C5_9BACI